jgi:PAS domain-containing protein
MGVLILQQFRTRGELYRRQAFWLVLAMFPPFLGNAIYLTDLNPLPNLDLSPFAFALTGILIIRLLYRHQLLNVVPIARDRLIESMTDGVLVLDGTNRVVDINPAGRRLMDLEEACPIGQDLQNLLPAWVGFFDQAEDCKKGLQKTILQEGVAQHLEVDVVRLRDAHGHEGGKLITLRDVSLQKKLETEREELLRDLQDVMSQIKVLNGLLPICSNCKKIRDDQGSWHQIEDYIHQNSEADFSHGICPECAQKLYPEYCDP